MRSSGRTTVSRTSERIDSVRRSRRGLLVRSACSILRLSLLGIVLIFFLAYSPEKVARATGGAEIPPGLFKRAVLAEPFSAHHAPVQMQDIFGTAAGQTTAFFCIRHA